MARIIAVVNQKGGVGKTTTVINLSASLAALGKKTLLVDMDPQANATSGVGLDKNAVDPSIYEVLLELVEAGKTVVATPVPRLDALPSNRHLVGAEVELIDLPGRALKLRNALAPLRPTYDYVIIDCPPSLGLLTINALTAADSVLVPLQCEYFAMEGLSELIRTLQLVKRRLNPQLQRDGILLTMFDRRNRLSFQVGEETRRLFGDLVLRTQIPRNVRLSEATATAELDTRSTARSVRGQYYTALAHELLRKHDRARRPGKRGRRGEAVTSIQKRRSHD